MIHVHFCSLSVELTARLDQVALGQDELREFRFRLDPDPMQTWSRGSGRGDCVDEVILVFEALGGSHKSGLNWSSQENRTWEMVYTFGQGKMHLTCRICKRAQSKHHFNDKSSVLADTCQGKCTWHAASASGLDRNTISMTKVLF